MAEEIEVDDGPADDATDEELFAAECFSAIKNLGDMYSSESRNKSTSGAERKSIILCVV